MSADEKVAFTLTVNGVSRQVDDVWYFESLLNVLRDHLGLTGTKYACDEGHCGACTVHVDGQAINSCIALAADAIGSEIVTIEGYSEQAGERPTALQEALIRGGDVQCGYCMPGIVMSASAFLAENPHPSEQDVREGMSGNLCRCTGYNRIIDAVREAGEVER